MFRNVTIKNSYCNIIRCLEVLKNRSSKLGVSSNSILLHIFWKSWMRRNQNFWFKSPLHKSFQSFEFLCSPNRWLLSTIILTFVNSNHLQSNNYKMPWLMLHYISWKENLELLKIFLLHCRYCPSLNFYFTLTVKYLWMGIYQANSFLYFYY